MRVALALFSLASVILAGCNAKDPGLEASNDPTGPCKRLWIPREPHQALILGTYADTQRPAPPITTARLELRAGRQELASDSLDQDGCVRLALPHEAGELTFYVKNQDDSGCRWAATRSLQTEGTGLFEFEMRLRTSCG